MAALGFEGIEIAPSRIWRDTWKDLKASDVAAYGHALREAGLKAVGLHSLFYDHPHLGLFRDSERRAMSLDFLTHLSAVCRDLGGKTLIWGGGRKRGAVPADAAIAESIDFMAELCGRVQDHGTVFCFEPLGPDSTDFVNSALESLEIAAAVDHPAMAVQLDAKALFENQEACVDTFRAVAGRLVHFHANEPDLGILGTSGKSDHAAMGHCLRDINYQGYVSAEQRQLNDDDPMADIARSMELLKRHYGTKTSE